MNAPNLISAFWGLDLSTLVASQSSTKKSRFLIRGAAVVLAAFLFLPVLASAQEDTLILLGSNSEMYHIYAVSAYNKNAFVTDDDWGLRVINYSDPYDPYTVIRYTESARDIEIRDSLAYYVGGFELHIRDISDPLESEIIGACSIYVYGYRVHLFDTLALVMYQAPWLFLYLDILDISDPTDPQPLSRYISVPPYSTSHWGDVYKKDNYVYWVDREYSPDAGKIIVFDITDPTEPVPIVVDTCLPSPPYGISIKDDYAYVALANSPVVDHGGLMVLDISDPYNIDSVGFFEIPQASAFNVYIKGNLAYVSAHIRLPPYVEGDGVYVLDISDPTYPSLVTYYHTPGSPRDVFVDEPYVLVADYYSLLVFEATFLNMPGDVNEDGEVDLGDVVFLINYLYKQGEEPEPIEAGDVNEDCIVDLGDVIYLINFLYRDGPAPLNGCAG